MSRLFSRLSSRRPLLIGTGASVAALTGYSLLSSSPSDALPADPAALYYGSRHLRLDSPAEEKLNRPSRTWTPPTRAEMLSALGCRVSSSPTDYVGKIAEMVGLGGYVGGGPKEVLEAEDEEFDLLIVGGGATGAGVALDAASRGLRVALVERDDYSSGESYSADEGERGLTRFRYRYLVQVDQARSRWRAIPSKGRL
jgi:hypothetical protein